MYQPIMVSGEDENVGIVPSMVQPVSRKDWKSDMYQKQLVKAKEERANQLTKEREEQAESVREELKQVECIVC